MAIGAAGLGAGACGITAGRGVCFGAGGGVSGIRSRGRGASARTSNSAVTLPVLGAFCVSGGWTSGMMMRVSDRASGVSSTPAGITVRPAIAATCSSTVAIAALRRRSLAPASPHSVSRCSSASAGGL